MEQGMRTSKRRILACVLALAMLAGMLPDMRGVYAEEAAAMPSCVITVQVGSGETATMLEGASVKYTVSKTKTTGGETETSIILTDIVEQTGSDGKATLTELQNELKKNEAGATYRMDLAVEKAGYYTVQETGIAVTAAGVQRNKTLEPAYTVTIQDKDEGTAIKDASVTVCLYQKDANGKETAVSGAEETVKTDENGVATLQKLKADAIGAAAVIRVDVTAKNYYAVKASETSVAFTGKNVTVEMTKSIVNLDVKSNPAASDGHFAATVTTGNETLTTKQTTISKDETTTVTVSAAEGYVLTSVKKDAEEQLNADAQAAGVKEMPVMLDKPQNDVTIEVTAVQAYQVTVTVDGEGSVSTNAIAQGNVQVIKKDGKLLVTATPNAGYRLATVRSAELAIPKDDKWGTNDYAWTKRDIGKVTKNTTLTVNFEPNQYTVQVTLVDADENCNGWFGETQGTSRLELTHGAGTTLQFTKSMLKNIDTVTRQDGTDTPAAIWDACREDSRNGNLFTYALSNVTEDVAITVTYQDAPVINPADGGGSLLSYAGAYTIDMSPVHTYTQDGRAVYVLGKGGQATITPASQYQRCSLNEETQYTASIVLTEETCVEALNLYQKKGVTVRVEPLKLGIVPDAELPEVKLGLSAGTNKPANGDVQVRVTATDAASGTRFPAGSGIQSITYAIAAEGKPAQSFTVLREEPNSGTQTIKDQILTISASDYNADDIKVVVRVTDYAGNVTEKLLEDISIDVTAPVVSLTYDNNQNYKETTCFHAPRTATLTIRERKDFDLEKAGSAIAITATDIEGKAVEHAYTVSGWSTQDIANSGDKLYTAAIAFVEDANYTVQLKEFTDAAGNLSGSVDTGNSVAPYAFVIDTTSPVVTVGTQLDGKTKKEKWDKLLSVFTFERYATEKIAVTATAKDATSPIQSMEYYKQVINMDEALPAPMTQAQLAACTDWKPYENFTVTEDETFVVYLKVTDAAGNCSYVCTEGLVLDTTSPKKETLAPKITAKPAQPVNGYYNKDVTVDVKIEDPEVNKTYSGISKIIYRVYNEAQSTKEPVQESVLYTAAAGGKAQKTWSGKIKVDSSLCNSDKIRIEVHAQDMAGNAATYTKMIKIDTTAPKVEVAYSNNDEASDRYFDADRVATITVTERNFDKKDMAVKVTCSEGKAPVISDWTKSKGTGNGDDTKWVAKVKFDRDADYTFDIACQDRAGNKAKIDYAEDTVAGTKFTIDKTKPVLSVSYDGAQVRNGEYYNTARRATVTITEHNFDPERVDVQITAQENGKPVEVPAISGWTTKGDVHTATVNYTGDAKYTFRISAIDMAGNEADAFAQQEFYVDCTEPLLEITGVEDLKAYAGDVMPVIQYADDNLDENGIRITLTGANRKEVKLNGTAANTATGGTYTLPNFEKTQDMDDIYTLSASITDKAGNTVSKTLMFSVNRFGSTYDFDAQTDAMNENFVQTAEDIVVVETNPTPLSEIAVTLFQNSDTIVLKEGTDYSLATTGGNGQWYHYTYTIHKALFEKDGMYRLVLHSKDGAENVSENILESKDAEISFGVDKTAPNLVVANLESKKTYAVDSLAVILSAKDNLKLTDVTVYLDEKAVQTWKDAALEETMNRDGELQFVIPGTSNRAHTVRIVCHDAAGNETVETMTDFYVTTNLWVRFYNNKPVFYGSIAGVFALTGLCVFGVIRRRRKKAA